MSEANDDVEIFTGPRCGYCHAAKALLTARGFEFRERDVTDPSVLEEMRDRLPDAKTIPQIFIGNEHIGGYDDLVLHFKDQ